MSAKPSTPKRNHPASPKSALPIAAPEQDSPLGYRSLNCLILLDAVRNEREPIAYREPDREY